jgi:two-component system, LytTR family, response regulator
MNYKCIIVDDEPQAHKVLESHLSKIDDIIVVANLYNGKEALDFLNKNKIDFIFLDIEMPKLTGLELLECLPYPTSVILTTAYSNFGFEAYQNDVVDYLLKPISYPRFLKAINKVTHLLNKNKSVDYPDIEIKHEGVIKRINTRGIIYIEAVGNYIKIYQEHHKPLLITQTTKYISSLLPLQLFTRIHKSFIVNRSFISEINKNDVTLSNKLKLPIGRRYSVLLEYTQNDFN